MTIFYVDPVTPCIKSRRWPYEQSCHLFTDPGGLDRLHEFAGSIGLRPTWFQCHKDLPHYDLTATMRAKAVRAGAKALTRKDAVAIWRTWRPT